MVTNIRFLTLLVCLVLNGKDKVDSKVEQIGSKGRKYIIVEKVKDQFRLIKANDSISKYELSISKNFKIKLFQYGGDKPDEFNIEGKRYVVSSILNKLTDKNFNPRYISPEYMETFYLTFNKKKYLVITTVAQGASGKAVNLSLFFLFDITELNKIKYSPATSYYGSIKNITDINNDGKLDFLKVRERGNDKYEIKAFEVFTNRQRNIKEKTSLIF